MVPLKILRMAGVTFLASVCLSFDHNLSAQPAGVLREVYSGIGGVAVSDLTSNPNFPANPTAANIITDFFESPTNVEENYGQRMRALVTAPATGNYTFWIATDDGGQLFLGTDDTPGSKRLIASVASWTSPREWTKEPNQKSAPIALTAGQKYYIEALMKEGGGGDNLAVRWQLPSGTIEEPIPASRLTVYGLTAPQITQQPTPLTVVEGSPATFTVKLSSNLGATFQWQRNGANIAGATDPTYTLLTPTLADSGATFRCLIANPQGNVTSSTATLTVAGDNTQPTLTSVANLGGTTTLSVLFSERVEAASATQRANYSISGGVGIVSASLDTDERTVILATTPLTPGVSYTLTVSNVRDRASTPNTIAANTQRSFSVDFTPLDISDVLGRSESPGPSSRRTGLVISEIMYHPAGRTDGKDLEFVEIYNSNPFFEDLGGYRLTGAIDFTFPANTKINGRSYLVVARVPADVQNVHGLSSVLGPYLGGLQNGDGTVRLRNHLDAVLLEANYSGAPPYPASADGAGHSLVLARPSYGERNSRAWAASAFVGGSPGSAEPGTSHPHRTVVINEFLAHTDEPDLDYIELYNYSAQPVDISGCKLSDDPSTNKFTIPPGTVIATKGFVVFNQNQLGFALNAAGETLFLRNPSGDRVIDSVCFDGQANGVATGRFPDGAGSFHPLAAKTPGGANAPLLISDVVINEIMYDPISGDADDQFVELHNRGTTAVDLSGWRLRDAVEFKFPANTRLAGNGYLVIANNAARLLTNYTGLSAANTLGNFSGKLPGKGGRLQLDRPDDVISTNSHGVLVTNTIHILTDEVTWDTGGRWGRWADGGGSSLELTDAHSDHRLASNWADSDESTKSAWKTIEWTGVLDNGNGAADSLQIFLQGPGECLVDNVEVFAAGGQNLIANSTFESGVDGWAFQGTHDASGWETNEGFGSSRSLHLRAAGRGDTGANRVRTALTSNLNSGQTATLRARVRWLKGNPEILLRLHGNWLEAPGNVVAARNFGTPGARNSRALANAGPAIFDVTHSPVLPRANQSVTVQAKVHDPDGVAVLQLSYRVDPSTNVVTISMAPNGAGLFSATIPGQATGALVAFSIRAKDGAAPGAASVFPNDAPTRECLIRFGDPTPTGTFGSYYLWFTKATLDRWSKREKNSNKPLDATFAYNQDRVFYNVGTLYSGSPWHTPGYSSPIAGVTDYVVNFPDDDPMLGTTDFVLASVGNLDSDDSAQREQAAFWMLGQLGVQGNYRRYVNVFVLGQRRGKIFEDSQQPNADLIEQWFPDDDQGDLHKIEDWFEFDTTGDNKQSNVDATLQNFTTTGGAKKLARYRWNWRKRAVSDSANAYTNLFQLVDALNSSGSALTTRTEAIVEVDQWARVFCVEHIAGNWDAYGYGRGKNMYAYKPDLGRWNLFAWDIDFVLGSGSNDAVTDMFAGVNDPTISKFLNHPPFRRAYFRAMEDAVNGPLDAARVGPLLDAKYAAFQANSIGANNPSAIKSFIAARREFILTNHLSKVAANFAITTSGGGNFSSDNNTITLSGTAPVGVKTIEINGVAYPLTWSTVTSWSLTYALGPGVNNLDLRGYDTRGNAIAGAQKSIQVTLTGGADAPENSLVINEIMYNAAVPNATFVEIFNRSTRTAFDLSNWRLEGADFAFPEGTLLAPGGFVVIANDAPTFAATYGSAIPIAGIYAGRLQNGGETLTLVKPGATPAQDLVIDQVTYDREAPWPSLANGFGPSLQLIDAAQDNGRVANWAAATGAGGSGGGGGVPTMQSLLKYESVWRFNQAGADLGTAWKERSFNDASWTSGGGLHYNETAALPANKTTALNLGPTTYYFRTHFNFTGAPASTTLNLSLILDDGAVVYLNGTEIYRLGMPADAITSASFAARSVGDAAVEGPFTIPGTALVAGDNVLAVEVHQVNATSSDVVFGLALDAVTAAPPPGGTSGAPFTPGTANSVRTTLPVIPTLWLNEICPNNTSGAADRLGERDPWLEIFNSGAAAINLGGYFLSDDAVNLTRWPFPAGFTINPGQRLVVWLDGQAAQSSGQELHASFRAAPVDGVVFLTSNSGGATVVVDYLRYRTMTADRSYGAFPDGTATKRQKFFTPTPGAVNNNAIPPFPIFINEWMAANTRTIADPADGQFDDWFELFNAGPAPVDLSGFTLTDVLAIPAQWTIPDGTVIGAGARLLVWADGEPGQNAPGGDLHANFKLSGGGEAIALFNSSGALVDSVTFGAQSDDVSQGRWPDGNSAPFLSMTTPTPGAANQNGSAPSNLAPVLASIGNKPVNEATTLAFIASATDANAGQSLTFALGPGAPAGASVNPSSGVFTWTPTEAQGPGNFTVTVRVTDNGSPALFDTETFTIAVAELNAPPALAAIGDLAVAPGGTINFGAQANDPDLPAQALTFSLENPPAGASVNPATGAFTWTPTAAQSGKTYAITLLATDNGTPPLNAARTFNVTVASGNTPPKLALIGNKSVAKGSLLTFTASATDSDSPAQQFVWSLSVDAPTGASIHPATGVFNWTPGPAQGPANFPVTITVTDNGTPPLNASETILIAVAGVNTPPIFASLSDKTVAEGATVSFAVLAGDRDVPAQRLAYTLDPGAPGGATLNPDSQLFTWTPTEAQGPGTYPITIRVTDDGVPPLSVAQTVTIRVTEVNTKPVLTTIPDQSVAVGSSLSFTAAAADVDLPAQKLTFALLPGAPAGATIDAAGVFSWTPPASEPAGVRPLTLRVTDDAFPALGDEKSFIITVTAAATIQVTGISQPAPGLLQLTWTAQPQRVYRVQFRDDLGAGGWRDLGPPTTASATTATHTDTVGAGPRYYRVVSQ